MMEAVAPSCLSISQWRATGSPFMLISIVFDPCQSGPVYSFCLQQAFLGKGEGRLPVSQKGTLPTSHTCPAVQRETKVSGLVVSLEISFRTGGLSRGCLDRWGKIK